jgi:serine/threonine protein kinase/Tfp pilus assembly protein PilF
VIGKTIRETYEVYKLVARGGYGEVCLGRDVRTNTIVAIKTLRPEVLANPVAVRRFHLEAELARSLSDPHVVRVFDEGELDGVPYLVMEYVQGLTLAQIVRSRGPLPIAEAVDYVSQILQALAEAHSKGIVHRDIKPLNVMVLDGQVKVMDFGIAKVDLAESMTESALLVGTPRYMAPEQADGSRGDARSDLYAVAVTLYELLAGQPPFNEGTPVQVAYQQVHSSPPPIARFRSDLPGALVEALRRGLEKDPQLRFQTAADMRQAILDATRDEPVDATVALPALAAETVAIVGPARLPAEEAERPPTVVTPPPKTSDVDGTSSIGVIGQPPVLPASAAEPDGANLTPSPSTAAHLAVMNESVTPVPSGPLPTPLEAPIKPGVAMPAGRRRLNPLIVVGGIAGLVVIGLIVLFATGVMRDFGFAPTTTSAAGYVRQGQTDFANGNYDKALAAYNQALSLDPNDVSAYVGRGNVYARQNKLDLALADYSKAVDLAPKDAIAFVDRGNVYARQNKLDLALADYTKAIGIASRDTSAYTDRGNVYVRQNKLDLALADFTKAIDVDPNDASAYVSRGNVYKTQGQTSLSLADFRRYLQLAPNAADRSQVEQSIAQLGQMSGYQPGTPTAMSAAAG